METIPSNGTQTSTKTDKFAPEALKKQLSGLPHGTFIASPDKEILWTNDDAHVSVGNQIPEGSIQGKNAIAFMAAGIVYHAAQTSTGLWLGGELEKGMEEIRSVFDFVESVLSERDFPILVAQADGGDIVFGNDAAMDLVGTETLEGKRLRDFLSRCPLDKYPSGYQNVGQGDTNTWRRYKSFHSSGLLAVWFPPVERDLMMSQEELLAEISGRLHDEAGQSLKSAQRDIEILEDELDNPNENSLDRLKSHVAEARSSITDEIKRARPIEDLPLFCHLNRILTEAHKKVNLDPGALKGSGRFDVEDQERKQLIVRIVEEFFANASHHNPPDSEVEVWIEIEQRGGTGIIHLGENGQGYDPNTVNRGTGLKMMKRRAHAAKVEPSLNAEPGEGSWLTLRVGNLEETGQQPKLLDVPLPAFLWNGTGVTKVNDKAQNLGLTKDLSALFEDDVPRHLRKVLNNGGSTTARTSDGHLEFHAERTDGKSQVMLNDYGHSNRTPRFRQCVLPIVTVLAENRIVIDANKSARERFNQIHFHRPVGETHPKLRDKDLARQIVISEEEPVAVSAIETQTRGIVYRHLTFHTGF